MHPVSSSINPYQLRDLKAQTQTAPAAHAFTNCYQSDVQQHISRLLEELSFKLLDFKGMDSSALPSAGLAPILGIMVAAMDDSDKANRAKEKLLGLPEFSWSPELANMIHFELSKVCRSNPYLPQCQLPLVASKNFFSSAFFSDDQSLDTTLREYYETEKLVLADNRSVADQTIQFVKKATFGRVRNIFEGILPPDGQQHLHFIFGNVLHIYGNWQHAFDVEKTSEGQFTCANSDTVRNIQMMEQTGTFRYVKDNDFFAVSKGLHPDSPDDQVDLVAIIPDQHSGKSINDLDQNTLKELCARVTAPECQTSRICLKLPKIAIDCTMNDLQVSIANIQGVEIPSDSLVSKLNLPEQECSSGPLTIQKMKALIDEKGASFEIKTTPMILRSNQFGTEQTTFDHPCFLGIFTKDINGNQRQLMALLVRDQRFLVPSKNGIEILKSPGSHCDSGHYADDFHDADEEMPDYSTPAVHPGVAAQAACVTGVNRPSPLQINHLESHYEKQIKSLMESKLFTDTLPVKINSISSRPGVGMMFIFVDNESEARRLNSIILAKVAGLSKDQHEKYARFSEIMVSCLSSPGQSRLDICFNLLYRLLEFLDVGQEEPES